MKNTNNTNPGHLSYMTCWKGNNNNGQEKIINNNKRNNKKSNEDKERT